MKLKSLFIVLVIFSFLGATAAAHVPFLEFNDYREGKPFVVRRMVEQSKIMGRTTDSKSLLREPNKRIL